MERAALAGGAHRLGRRPDGGLRDPGPLPRPHGRGGGGINKFFVGIILIPLIGNLAEHVVGITLAYKNKMDFSLVTSLGSATQIALFAAPVLVIFGLLVGNELTLVFSPLEVVAVGVGTLIAAYIAARRSLELGGRPAA